MSVHNQSNETHTTPEKITSNATIANLEKKLNDMWSAFKVGDSTAEIDRLTDELSELRRANADTISNKGFGRDYYQ